MCWSVFLAVMVLSTVNICAEPFGLVHTASEWAKRASEVSNMTHRILDVVHQMSEGPAMGRNLKLHLDPALPSPARDTILALQPLPAASSLPPLHLVFYITTPLHSIDFWYLHGSHPRHLLLVILTLNSSAESLLRHPVLNEVQSLAILVPLPSEQDSLAVFTLRPFCSPPLYSLGIWESNKFPMWNSLFLDRFPTLCQCNFHLASILDDYPFLHQDEKDNTVGISVQALNALSGVLNFTYILTKSSVDGQWGNLQNGSWVGLLGMVQGDYHFSPNSFMKYYQISLDFDFSFSFWQDGFGIFLRMPDPLPQWMSLTQPFTLSVWATLAGTFLLAWCYLTLKRQQDGKSGGEVLTLVQPLLGQSTPRVLWPRPLAVLWFLTCMIITTAFTCKLVGIFTRPDFPPRLNSLAQLADSPIRLAMTDLGYSTPGMLQSSSDAVYRRLGHKMDLFTQYKDTVEAMTAGTHAFMDISEYSKFILEKYQKRNWYQLPEMIFPGHMSWVFKKNQPWKAKFDKKLQQLTEAGLFQHWFKVENSKPRPGAETKGMDGSESESHGSLTMNHLQGSFWLLGLLGWLTGSLIFLLEILITIYRKHGIRIHNT